MIQPIANKPTDENKTGSWRIETPVVTDRCAGCGICAGFCPDGCIRLVAHGAGRQAQINYDFCKGCLICAAECPLKAIMVKKG
ncbi:MAG: 4Fe-4S binding protein [Candidatus Aenigmatarchaeota archaeon]